MQYMTRERVHVDRIATAWLLRRFIDPAATFAFVPRGTKVDDADGVTFDMRGAQIGQRGADLPHEAANPAESPGVPAIFPGVRDRSETDQQRLSGGFIVCEALYACRQDAQEAESTP